MEEAYNLEDPRADQRLNSGTAAPNCQPKHTTTQQKEAMRREKLREMDEGKDSSDDSGSSGKLPDNTHKHRRTSSTMSEREDQEERRKRQHQSNNGSSRNNSANEQEMSAAEQQKKLSYFQMARLGYQELVNAIIRPPRADYKVRIASAKVTSPADAVMLARVHVFLHLF